MGGALVAIGLAAPPVQAIHLYRGPGGGCTPATGELTDDPGPGPSGPVGATVLVLHNTFNDNETHLGTTTVKAGQSVVWEWSSAHCHSVLSDAGAGTFYSGFHYPTDPPESPQAVPGVVEYPVPDSTPTLSYRRTFDTPGTYTYKCEHHASIGMTGTIVVEA